MKILLIITAIGVLLSFLKDQKKTLEGLKKGAVMFLIILPTILSVIIIVSVLLYLIPEQKIAVWFGEESGVAGYVAAALVGAVSLIQGFIAYPLAGVLVESGVGYPVIAVFITTLMMVGIMTLPVEARYFGIRLALVRNSLALVFALIIGLGIGILWNHF
ncbi:MAG: permease [Bacteroidales bacterium]|nr:permease [Bacteroidales bacterium]